VRGPEGAGTLLPGRSSESTWSKHREPHFRNVAVGSNPITSTSWASRILIRSTGESRRQASVGSGFDREMEYLCDAFKRFVQLSRRRGILNCNKVGRATKGLVKKSSRSLASRFDVSTVTVEWCRSTQSSHTSAKCRMHPQYTARTGPLRRPRIAH
jgi:hypothetical protein